MNFEQFIKSKSVKITAGVIGGLLIAFLIFAAGVFVGLQKARFSYNFGQNYMSNFGGRGSNKFFLSDRNFINGHGSTGQIIKINPNTITIKDGEGVEKAVTVSANTAIRSERQDIKFSDLKTGDFIVAIGTPNSQGQIQADLIRVLPNPGQMPMPTAPLAPPAPTH